MHDLLDLIRPWAAFAAIGMTVPTTWIYFVKIRRGETKPHVLTWTVLPSITLSSAILQLTGGAGWGMTPLLFAAITGYMFAFMAWRRGYMGVVTRLDYACIALSVTAWIVWLAADQAVLAVIALSTASIMAFVPTFRKSWNLPHDEPVSKYALSVLRYGFASIAVVNYSFVTGFYPTLWIGVNAGLTILLIVRRNVLGRRIDEVVAAVEEAPVFEMSMPRLGDPIADAAAAEARRLGPVSHPDDLDAGGPPTAPEYELYDLVATQFMDQPRPDSVTVTDPSNTYGYWVMHRVRRMFADQGFEVSRVPAGDGAPETVTFTHPRVLERELAALEA